MEKQILVSVIVPIYGVEKYIERCARSLFEQTLSDGIEFIFVDDASQDRSLEILNDVICRYPNRKNQISIIHHEKNRGLSAARNTGVNLAKGEYVINVDSDDYFENSMVEKMYTTAKRFNADIVVADYYLTYRHKEIYIDCQIPTSKKTLIENLIIGGTKNSIGRMNWNKLIRRSLYTRNNIHFIDGINYNEDLIVMVPLCCSTNNIVKINEAFAHYVQTNPTSYTKKRSIKNTTNRIYATRYIEKYLSQYHEDYTESIKIKKINDKLNALINSSGEIQREYLHLYPELSYDKHLMQFINHYWRHPFRLALKGHLFYFNLWRECIMRIKILYYWWKNFTIKI